MINNLLVTKLCAPMARSNLVARQRLTQKLDEGQHPGRKFSLVSAPAGYGKTTLVSEWLQGLQTRSAWLSLDEGDNDPARFLAYLITALEGVIGKIPGSIEATSQSPQPAFNEAAVTAIINAVAPTPEALTLVLDDYHVIHNPDIHQQIAFLLEHQPAHMHLVLITRADPLLPISRFRARGQVVEIRQDDLRFSLEECRDFLRRITGISLSREDIAALERRTEGWIAGLQLAALSMQGRDDLTGFIQAFTGSSRFILDYLIEEVFERQTPEVKDFLLKTSILEQLSGPLCDAVAEIANSQALLERMEQANLFIIPLDQSRLWYRYHNLFSELLRQRLRSLDHSLEVALHHKASQWYEAQGYLAEAVEHTLEIKDWNRGARLVGQAGDALLKRGELVTLIGWFEKMPDEVIAPQPALGLSYAWALALLGRFDPAEGLLTRIEAMAGSIPPLMGQVAAAQAYVARGKGDNPRAIEKSEQALALLPADANPMRGILLLNLGLVYWHTGRLHEAQQVLNGVVDGARRSGNLYALLTARIFLARTLASRGELRRAEQMYRQIIQEGGQVPILALAYYDLHSIYYEWNHLEKAEEHLDKGLELCLLSGNVEFQNSGHLLKAYLLLAHGNGGGALAEVEIAHKLSRAFNPATQARSAACHAQIALAMGDIHTAAHWVAQMEEDIDAHSFYRFVGLVHPRLLIAQSKGLAARELLRECSAKASQAGWGYALVAIRILQALAADDREAALDFLKEALSSSQAEGFIRAYVDEGHAVLPLLQESARRGSRRNTSGKFWVRSASPARRPRRQHCRWWSR